MATLQERACVRFSRAQAAAGGPRILATDTLGSSSRQHLTPCIRPSAPAMVRCSHREGSWGERVSLHPRQRLSLRLLGHTPSSLSCSLCGLARQHLDSPSRVDGKGPMMVVAQGLCQLPGSGGRGLGWGGLGENLPMISSATHPDPVFLPRARVEPAHTGGSCFHG